MTDSPSTDPFLSSTAHADALAAGERLAEFEVLGLLGVGGFGMVYRAFDHSLQRSVAIKEYMPTALARRAMGQGVEIRSPADAQAYQAGLASFVSEARLLAQFDHPSLVKVFRFWEANHTAYMVMPLYAGMTLHQACARMTTPASEEWLRHMLWSVLGALRVLHDARTLHRDISPDNIFLQDDGPPVLLDLGAARRVLADQARRHTAVLKVHYAPIEQFADNDDDLVPGPWSDLYSLAAVVYGCIRQEAPLPAAVRSIRDSMPPLQQVARDATRRWGIEYSQAFVHGLSRALSVLPEERPQSIDDFLDSLGMAQAPTAAMHVLPSTVGRVVAQAQVAALAGDVGSAPPVSGPVENAVPLAPPVVVAAPPRQGQRGTRAARALVGGGVALVLLAVAAGAGWIFTGADTHPGHATGQEEILTEWVEPQPLPQARPDRPEPPAELALLPAGGIAPALSRPAAASPAPSPAAAPAALCAGENFLLRPLCLHRECQKPQYAKLALCVETQRRYEAEQQRLRELPG